MVSIDLVAEHSPLVQKLFETLTKLNLSDEKLRDMYKPAFELGEKFGRGEIIAESWGHLMRYSCFPKGVAAGLVLQARHGEKYISNYSI